MKTIIVAWIILAAMAAGLCVTPHTNGWWAILWMVLCAALIWATLEDDGERAELNRELEKARDEKERTIEQIAEIHCNAAGELGGCSYLAEQLDELKERLERNNKRKE